MDWIRADWSMVPLVFVSVAGIYAVLMVVTRLNGLRSYAKMSSHDFAITVAIGSVVGGTVLTRTPPLTQGAVALVALFLCQRLIAWSRVRLGAGRLVDNPPLLLMRRRTFRRDAMAKARVTEADILAKLREANVLSLAEVHAVVLEATGDISVLHSASPDRRLDDALLSGVRGVEANV